MLFVAKCYGKKKTQIATNKNVKHEKYIYKLRSVALLEGSSNVFYTVRNLGQNAASVESAELE